MRQLHLLLIALLACSLVAVGCGGDDDNDDESDTPAAVETTPADTGDTVGTDEDEGALGGEDEDSGAVGDSDVGAQAVEACKESVRTAGQLSEDVRQDLEEICEQAAEGDEESVREASVEICKKFAEELPEGAARDQAMESCEQAGEQ